MTHYLVINMALPFFAAIMYYIPKISEKGKFFYAIIINILTIITLALIIKSLYNSQENYIELILYKPYFRFTISLYSALFSAFIAIMWMINNIYTYIYLKIYRIARYNTFNFLLNTAIGTSYFIIYSDNLISSFIFYEFLTLSTCGLLITPDKSDRINARRVYLSYLLTPSFLFFFPAIILTYYFSHYVTYEDIGNIDYGIKIWLLFMFIFGISKTGIIPAHKWLPAAMVAPIPVSALLHSVAVVNIGAFLIIKIIFYMFCYHEELLKCNNISIVITAISAFSMLIAAYIGSKQKELKKLLAYSTISHMSFVLFLSSTLEQYGLIIASLYMIFHSINKMMMFYSVGNIYFQTGGVLVDTINGMGNSSKSSSMIMTIAAISLIGLPPFAGHNLKHLFVEYYTDHSIGITFVLGAILISVFSSMYLLPIIYKIWFSKQQDNIHLSKLPLSMNISNVILIMLNIIIMIFIYYITPKLDDLYIGYL